MDTLIVNIILVSSMMAITLSFEYFHVYGKLASLGYSIFNFLLFMMLDMYVSLAWYLSTPMTFLYSVVLLNLVMFPMFSYIVLLIFINNRNPWHRNYMIFYFSALIVIAELFMSLDILELSGSKLNLNSFILSVGSPYFLIPMAGEMLLGPVLKKLTFTERFSLLTSALMMLILPSSSVTLQQWLLLVDTVLMIITMAIEFEIVASNKNTILTRTKRIIDFSFTMMLLSAVGIFIYYSTGMTFPSGFMIFSIIMVTFMIIFLYLIFHEYGSAVSISWGKRRSWLFYLLFSSFLAEVLISASLDIITGIFTVQGTGIDALVFLIENNIPYWNISSIPLDSLLFIATITSSYIFLLVMGTEMITLVIFRIKKIKWREKRINLSLAIVAYLIYTVYGPNFVPIWNRLPLWANVGSAGPLTKYVLLPVLLSYAVYAILAFLFGRRSYCSTLCPSAVMYGGTLGESMVSLNYATKLSKKNLGSRFSNLAMLFISTSWIFFILSAVLSFLNSLNFIHLDFDPSVAFSLLIWNLLWYVFFISIPFVGMSPCRRYGWCTTGTLLGLISYLGLFKIVAADPMQCYKCPTKDCVTACEVGISDIPAQLIKRGYFKSIKCVGSGSCIMACPYENIRFHDVRDSISIILKSNKAKGS